MGKKKAEKKAEAPSNHATGSSTQEPTQVVFPKISAKQDLECQALLDDQILIIDVSNSTEPLTSLD